MNITYIGAYATGTIHQMFDTAFLHCCSLIAERVDCYKHSSTFKFIEDKGSEYGYIKNVQLHPIYIYQGKKKFQLLMKDILSAFSTICLYARSPRENVIIANYNNIFAIHILNALSKLLKKELWVVCHGEMELLAEPGKEGLWAKLKRMLLNNFFLKRKIYKGFHFIVLGDSILKSLERYLSVEVMSHFKSIEHPYYLEEDIIVKDNKLESERLALGLIGILSPSKGLNEFIDFVEKLEKRNINCSISIIGRISTHKFDDFMNAHHIQIAWDYLEREEMERRIRQLDYVLFFYPVNTYQLIASGAVFDAIKLNMPVVSLKNKYFEQIFNKMNYPAILCNNVDRMVDAIANRSGMMEKKLIDKSIFSPQNVAKSLKTVIEEQSLLYHGV
jgi:glycosyltransferase involved in cell wall biosynthesis